jgi:hypothetical protein
VGLERWGTYSQSAGPVAAATPANACALKLERHSEVAQCQTRCRCYLVWSPVVIRLSDWGATITPILYVTSGGTCMIWHNILVVYRFLIVAFRGEADCRARFSLRSKVNPPTRSTTAVPALLSDWWARSAELDCQVFRVNYLSNLFLDVGNGSGERTAGPAGFGTRVVQNEFINRHLAYLTARGTPNVKSALQSVARPAARKTNVHAAAIILLRTNARAWQPARFPRKPALSPRENWLRLSLQDLPGNRRQSQAARFSCL